MSVITYLKDTRGELRHVSWPTQKQAVAFTVLVIAISVVIAALLGVFDTLFTKLFQSFVLGG